VPRPKKAPRWLEAARLRGSGERGDWLSRALSRAGVMPLAEAEEAIAHRRVTLDGRVATEPLSPVFDASRVTLDGRPVSLAWRTRVLMFHKPAGLVTHGSDPEGVGTVFDGLRAALPEALQRFGWHAVGRLDRDTTGLLLFTNDERFVKHATSPETHLEKRYVARVGGAVTEAKLAPLRQGLCLDGDEQPTRPARAVRRGDDVVELTLTEGRYHQVKRMLGAVGLPTLTLHREAVGALVLDVPEGACRELTDAEVTAALDFTPRRGHGG
jgi:23S rRNA pseudouridine2605 synthase/16S rRNA pseudouridine516 synthase